MKNNRLGHRYIELKNCIVSLNKRRLKNGFFLLPSIWVTPSRFFKKNIENTKLYPTKCVEFVFLKYSLYVEFTDKLFKEYV